MSIKSVTPEQNRSLEKLAANLRKIGYDGDLLEPHYGFGDWLSEGIPEATVELAAFGRTPVGFDSACFAVVASNGSAGVDRIRECRSLGAPRAFEVDSSGRVYHWRVSLSPVEQDRQQVIEPDKIDAVMREHGDEWGPDEMLRAKHIGPSKAQTKDFIDLGLLPAIEYNVREKLDPLLRDTLHVARRAHVGSTRQPPTPRSLFQLVFRALTGKIMHDRGVAGFATKVRTPDADTFLDRVAAHYGESEPLAISDRHVRQAVLDRLWDGVDLRNISVETLAYIWENTLLTKQDRRNKGIHATPVALARYILRRLPITESVAINGKVVEPCCGAGTFLVAAMERIRELLPRSMNSRERHKLFKNNLHGFDTESFGIEVAKCRLMLADFPHPNKWGLHREDVFGSVVESPMFHAALREASVVLCNPPFGPFNKGERKRYELESVYKPVEVLDRVLETIPSGAMLGFVLPLQILSGQSYRAVRSKLGKRFGQIEVLSLPDKVFAIAEQETAAIIAYGSPPARSSISLLHRKVSDNAWPAFRDRHEVSNETRGTVTQGELVVSLSLPDLPDVWTHLARRPRLQDVTDMIRRGIEWNIPLDENRRKLISKEPREGFRPGIASAPKGQFLAYQEPPTSYLCVKPEYHLYRAFDLPWSRPKAVMSAKRTARSPWRIAAFPDSSGLVCYQTFISLWPTAGGWSAEVLAAILNSPVANAFVASREGNRDITNETVADIPVPALSLKTAKFIANRVNEYAANASEMLLMNPQRDTRARRLLVEIDAVVLKAYRLPAKLESELLNYFHGHESDRRVSVPNWWYTHEELNRVYSEIRDELESPGESPAESWGRLTTAIDESRESTRKLFL